MKLENGMSAPDFTLSSTDGENISLADFRGKKNVVLYFYPKDDTPGCTAEACDFRDNMARLQKNDTVVLGVSKDDAKSHHKFAEKYQLPFPLLSDEEGRVIELYDSWKEKSMYGKTFMGIERSTYLIDRNGVIQHVWKKVKVSAHVDEVLAEIAKL